MLDLQKNEFLTKDQIREKANSVFAEKGGTGTSSKYSHIPTHQIIDDMSKLGWGVVDAKQVRARKNSGFQKHLIVFRNNDIVINGNDGDTVFPQILLTNSSDGKNAFTFRAGLFRLVCENGLVISTQDFADLKIRHFGYDFEELKKTITTMVEKLPLTVESMNKFKQTQMSEAKIKKFAEDALKIRFNEDEIKRIKIDLNDFTKAVRKEDEGSDLWSVFNRVQEKLINGDFSYGYSTKTRKARKIKNFNQDIELNSKLFSLASEYCLS